MAKRRRYIISVILIVWIAFIITDLSLAKANKSPIFAIPLIRYKDGGSTEYYGLGYKVIKYVNLTVEEGPEIRRVDFGTWLMVFSPAQLDQGHNEEKIKEHLSDRRPMVMINGELYFDTNRESDINGRCGVMDGEISSTVDTSEIPTQNNQSNFGAGYEYQYIDEISIDIYMSGKWMRFEKEIDKAYKNYDRINEYMKEESIAVFSSYYELLDFQISNYVEEVVDGDVEATFFYKIIHKNYDKDPDTVGYIKQAKESGNKNYQQMYDEYLELKEMNFDLKVVIDKNDIITLYSNVSPNGVEWEETEMSDFILKK
ncbi:hypothetical protein [Tissierella praeacuta]|uniref:hypothetical protein n=1 Tax=Tissierella praeacuta TaxID=43131 RepID=UPI003342B5F1